MKAIIAIPTLNSYTYNEAERQWRRKMFLRIIYGRYTGGGSK